MRLAGRFAVAVFVLAATAPPAARAQRRFPPDSLVNLKYFPKTIAVRDLLDSMRFFTFALGVRCQFCHVGRASEDFKWWTMATNGQLRSGFARPLRKKREGWANSSSSKSSGQTAVRRRRMAPDRFVPRLLP